MSQVQGYILYLLGSIFYRQPSAEQQRSEAQGNELKLTIVKPTLLNNSNEIHSSFKPKIYRLEALAWSVLGSNELISFGDF